MPKSPESEGVPRLMTVSEIALEHGVSRQTVHSYRTRGSFPKPVEGEGSTRPRFRADEVAAWFAANPPRPGKRTDLSARTEGEPMATPERTEPPLSDEGVERVTAVLAYQAALVTQKVGLPEPLARELAETVVKAVEDLAAKWAGRQDG